MLNKVLKYLLIFSVISCCIGCTEPKSAEYFLNKNQMAQDSSFNFMLDIKDSLKSYNINLYSVIDCNSWDYIDFDSLFVEIKYSYLSEDKEYKKVVINKKDLISNNFYQKTFQNQLDTNFYPKYLGEWIISVKPLNIKYNIDGFGIRMTTRK